MGAVSALSAARAFGITFLGQQRDPTVHVGAEPPLSMFVPMSCHAGLAIACGLAPQLGVGLVRGSLSLFPFCAPGDLERVLAPLTGLVYASRLLAGCLLVVAVLRWRQGLAARRGPTWGCGYSAASPRMQYTGSSFSEHFARIFASSMPALRRERIATESFPQAPGQLATHHTDAVEARIFEVLARGEDVITGVSERIPAQPRFAFAAGLLAVLIIGAVAWGGWR